MKKFRYHNISRYRKLRYSTNNFDKNPYIVFLPGFMSDIEGKKPNSFHAFANKSKIGFLAIEYSGHGKSSGKFIKGNISLWTNDAKILIKKIVKKNRIILVGSSMGAWISLNQFKFFKRQIKGFLGIGSAPEFLENLMWKKFSKKKKLEIINKGICYVKHGDYEYPITHQLIKDGRKNKILNSKIKSKIIVTLVHGEKDDVVPVTYSKKILKLFKNAKKKLIIVKNGDHSLSTQKWLNLLKKELKLIVN